MPNGIGLELLGGTDNTVSSYFVTVPSFGLEL